MAEKIFSYFDNSNYRMESPQMLLLGREFLKREGRRETGDLIEQVSTQTSVLSIQRSPFGFIGNGLIKLLQENNSTDSSEVRKSYDPDVKERAKRTLGAYTAILMFEQNGDYVPSHILDTMKGKAPYLSDEDLQEVYNEAVEISNRSLDKDAKKTIDIKTSAKDFYTTKLLNEQRKNAMDIGKVVDHC